MLNLKPPNNGPHNEAATPHQAKRWLKFSSPPPQSGHTTESRATPLICNATRPSDEHADLSKLSWQPLKTSHLHLLTTSNHPIYLSTENPATGHKAKRAAEALPLPK
ncbi:hypothetical protein LXL04_029277 [Taraxacum kok-saghyz]